MKKLCFIDTETTGLDEHLHHIWQIAIVITDPDLNELERLKLEFRPISAEGMSTEAIAKHGKTVEDLLALDMSAEEAFTIMHKLFLRHVNKYDKTDKMVFVGYNAQFDERFMRQFFLLNGDNWWGSLFWNPVICAMQAAMLLYHPARASMPNFKLETLCKLSGVGWDEAAAHDAEYDIIQTIELYRHILTVFGWDFEK